MLSLVVAAYLHQAQYCCALPTRLSGYVGTVCKDKASIDTVIGLYAENAKGDEEIAQKMVAKTHQCALLVFPDPLYIVYHGKKAWGTNGLGEVVGLAPRPTMSPLMFAIMHASGTKT
jgi:hypothetical protein